MYQTKAGVTAPRNYFRQSSGEAPPLPLPIIRVFVESATGLWCAINVNPPDSRCLGQEFDEGPCCVCVPGPLCMSSGNINIIGKLSVVKLFANEWAIRAVRVMKSKSVSRVAKFFICAKRFESEPVLNFWN